MPAPAQATSYTNDRQPTFATSTKPVGAMEMPKYQSLERKICLAKPASTRVLMDCARRCQERIPAVGF